MAEQKLSNGGEMKLSEQNQKPFRENTFNHLPSEENDVFPPLQTKYGMVRKVKLDDNQPLAAMEQKSNIDVANKPGRGRSCFTKPTTSAEYEQILHDIHSGKANSTSTVYATSTISAPCAEEIILCVSTAFHSQMVSDASDLGDYLSEAMFEFFIENDYFETEGEQEGKKAESKSANEGKVGAAHLAKRRRKLSVPIPELEVVFQFFQKLLSSGEIGPECLIVALIYINRLSSNTNIPIHASNWRPLVLSATILAQKMWDDRTLKLHTFAEILPGFGLESKSKLAQLEQRFLEMLRYDVLVDSSLYAEYYFELRSFSEVNGGNIANLPLNKADAKRLELRSRRVSQSYQSSATTWEDATRSTATSRHMLG